MKYDIGSLDSERLSDPGINHRQDTPLKPITMVPEDAERLFDGTTSYGDLVYSILRGDDIPEEERQKFAELNALVADVTEINRRIAFLRDLRKQAEADAQARRVAVKEVLHGLDIGFFEPDDIFTMAANYMVYNLFASGDADISDLKNIVIGETMNEPAVGFFKALFDRELMHGDFGLTYSELYCLYALSTRTPPKDHILRLQKYAKALNRGIIGADTCYLLFLYVAAKSLVKSTPVITNKQMDIPAVKDYCREVVDTWAKDHANAVTVMVKDKDRAMDLIDKNREVHHTLSKIAYNEYVRAQQEKMELNSNEKRW